VINIGFNYNLGTQKYSHKDMFPSSNFKLKYCTKLLGHSVILNAYKIDNTGAHMKDCRRVSAQLAAITYLFNPTAALKYIVKATSRQPSNYCL
jgi:hypothetical protein